MELKKRNVISWTKTPSNITNVLNTRSDCEKVLITLPYSMVCESQYAKENGQCVSVVFRLNMKTSLGSLTNNQSTSILDYSDYFAYQED